MKKLVVVESPTKARTIKSYLPADFQIEASMGHVRDLPSSAKEVPDTMRDHKWASLGVNVEDDFEPLYIVPGEKQKVVSQLKKALKSADELYIATDEDREGESIGWHLLEVLQPNVPVRRMVFHEITRDAIEAALVNTRQIDTDLVEAQETRRILDRLVGYSISPMLWKVISKGLSAGRVQSVAVRLLVQREKERMAFVPASYWDLKAGLEQNGHPFDAVMTHYGGIRLATGADFDDDTGRLKANLTAGENVMLLSEDAARDLAKRLPDVPWRVAGINERVVKRSPAPPFITSTLQQEGSRKLSLSARDTMRSAQRLYEQGYITYMRTDSPNLSKEALQASRSAVEKRYGKDYLSNSVRSFGGSVRNAQEAHEAIRPSGTQMKTAKELGLSGIDAKLYDLIWSRTIASQMAEARVRLVTAQIEADDGDKIAAFRASGRSVDFPGFFRAYVEGSDDPDAALENRDAPLPKLEEGDRPDCKSVDADGHETRPPARYTEATLIKTLESEGIGRPSTYATIIDTITRKYAVRVGTQLAPTFTAFAVNNFLEAQFEHLVDVGFTAEMEEILDDIAAGGRESKPYLKSFYETGLESPMEQSKDKIDPREISTISSPKWNGYVVRVGQYGPYVETQNNGEAVRASLPAELLPGEVALETLQDIIEAHTAEDELLGVHPEHDLPIFLKDGPYGPYVQLGEDGSSPKPKRQSLPKDVAKADATFSMAVDLLNLPRDVGIHPETGEAITASIGPYGPYVKHGRVYASLKPEDDVLSVGLERAVELLAQRRQKNKPLRELGKHPETGEPVAIFKGRYGPYVKHKKTNASLPKGIEPDDVTIEVAVDLLTEREQKKGKKGRKGGTRKKKT